MSDRETAIAALLAAINAGEWDDLHALAAAVEDATEAGSRHAACSFALHRGLFCTRRQGHAGPHRDGREVGHTTS